MDKIALTGPLSSENLCIEKVVRNVVSNPTIGYLILCGKDSPGHKAGQALLSLIANGLSEDGNILIYSLQFQCCVLSWINKIIP